MSIRIFRPVPTRADALSALMRKTYVEAYGQFCAADDVQAFLEDSYRPTLQAQELRDPFTHTWVATGPSRQWVGYAQLRSCAKPPECVPDLRSAQLRRIYLTRETQGMGVGTRLLRRAMGTAAQLGHATAWLTVSKDADGPLAFYRRNGFAVIGETYFRVGNDRMAEWVMVRAL